MQEMREAIINDRFNDFQRGFWDAYRPTDEAARQEQKNKWLKARGG
jgi:queuine/archaeosine tRNA-ribosyltransferase